MNWRNVFVLGLLAFAAPLFAQEEEAAEEESPWSGNVKLGYLATSGNTESSSLNSGFEINYTLELWEHQARAAAIYSTESSVTTAEAYDFGWKSARNLSDHDFLFGRLDWRKDRFGGITEQFSQSLGYGRRLVDKEKHQLNAELGIGARQSDLADGTDESDTIYTGRLTYAWQISETANFGQSLLVESGSSNTFTESVTGAPGAADRQPGTGGLVHGQAQQRRASGYGKNGHSQRFIAGIRLLELSAWLGRS